MFVFMSLKMYIAWRRYTAAASSASVGVAAGSAAATHASHGAPAAVESVRMQWRTARGSGRAASILGDGDGVERPLALDGDVDDVHRHVISYTSSRTHQRVDLERALAPQRRAQLRRAALHRPLELRHRRPRRPPGRRRALDGHLVAADRRLVGQLGVPSAPAYGAAFSRRAAPPSAAPTDQLVVAARGGDHRHRRRRRRQRLLRERVGRQQQRVRRLRQPHHVRALRRAQHRLLVRAALDRHAAVVAHHLGEHRLVELEERELRVREAVADLDRGGRHSQKFAP